DVVERILPEHVELERKHGDLVETAELQDLLQAVFGDVVEMVDVVRQVLRADERIGAVHGIDDDAAAGAQRAAREAQERNRLVERQVIEFLLRNYHVEGVGMRCEKLEAVRGLAGQPVAQRNLHLGGVGIYAEHSTVALLAQHADQVPGPATDDQDFR